MSRIPLSGAVILVLMGGTQAGPGQIGKAQQLLLERGLQLQGMVTRDDVFHPGTFSNAGFTSVNWLWQSDPAQLGPSPGLPWSRWVVDEANMPGPPAWPNESPYLSQLLSLQLADEWDLNNEAVRTRAVDWFIAARANWPRTLLYGNNWGGQVLDGPLGDFIARARPDMLCFDLYPFQSRYDNTLPNHSGEPLGWNRPNSLLTGWYSELRRYRAWALSANVPLAVYRQTFHSVQDYNQTVYRDPSPSELRLNTFVALAFNAKWLINFTYNTGASSLFTAPGGDTYPGPLYAEQADVNRRALNLGRALVRLQPLYELHNQNHPNPPPGPASSDPCACFQDGMVSSILFLRGRYLSGGATNWTDLPNSFQNDPQVWSANPANAAALGYSWWEYQKNDPFLTGWSVTNKAGVMNHGLPGEVILAWFRPLDESLDGPDYTNQLYLMVVNALTATNGTAGDCRQQIKLNFVAAVPPTVVMLDPISGQPQTNTMPVIPNSGGRRQLTLELDGGDAALFKFNTGAPFVGFLPPANPRLSIRIEAGAAVVTMSHLTPQVRYQLQCAPDLTEPGWSLVADLVPTNSTWEYIDAPRSNTFFYRAFSR